ncbi:hypothetical protein pEaSNUABM56_00147 [Erwinia phage pEa_SNUABM_56]|uniref:Uncharacterized protein n=1 Tax=Erwinia phage pEp_SNUABM_01 TaxID=2601643 RepID=A0A5J6DB38_9CAUD|nr:hypothetical protein HWC63_gp247 [Erwinia phage pEp_SNUABM_01]QEQ94931.1 hypothetical protein pEpSNUABM01_105 [Erwinia phage pEp_SNUABM_01]UYL84859.1 hypothetical protein pEaSNUABM55_00077 [Erwinia phage pEa_SNUABM_55]UYL85176.1 hypothetical protein pEaSNUABM56_00147 [Erwinia phage pEa_SNUABM_56]
MATQRRELDIADGWVSVATAASEVTIQVLKGSCHFAQGSAAPAANSRDFHVLDKWTALGDTVSGFVRAGSDGTTIVVTSL